MQELLALEPQFIEEDGSVIHIRQAVKVVKGTVNIGSPKSKDSIRDIPVPLNVRPCAIKLRDTTDQFIWESPKTGLPCNPTHFRDVFRKSLEEAGDVRLLTPHSCRHTYVSQMQALGVDILMVMSGFSSCGILFSGGTQVSGQTMYSAEDRDIRGAEQDYKKLEKELDKKIKRTPTDHPSYNEYQYHLDPIEHDPWQLTSYLTTLYDDYTRSEVQGKLKETFKKQYKLTTWVEVQIRYKTVWVISPAGIPVPTQVPYEYRIFHTKLVNKGLEVVIREELNNDQWKRYEIFQDTLGGRPYLFNGGLPPGGSDGSGTPGIDYQVPAEALTDEEFAAIYKEAQKYVGTPYVWGGSTPETGFDCSGYVCWVYNQNGYNVGRTTANGLWQKSQHISEAEAKPGDLVFFKGTYDTPGMSHTGIYLGNGMMVSAGDPIKYADIHSSYWQQYLAGFGRLSK